MRVDIKGVHYQITDVTRSFLEAKLEKVEFAKDYIVDLMFTLTKDNNDWVAEVNVNFKWGVSAHLKEDTFNLHESIEKLVDRLASKVKKEKARVQDNHR